MRYVYLMKTGDDHYKVGIASNVFNRLRALQTSSSTRIDLITAKRVENEFEVEKDIHKSYQHLKVGGGKEWFKLTESQALEIAIKINKYSSIDMSEIQSLRNEVEEQNQILQSLIDQHTQTVENVLSRQSVVYSRILSRLESLTSEFKHSDNMRFSKKVTSDVNKEIDPLTEKAFEIVKRGEKVSISLLQRKFSISYTRAAKIFDHLKDSTSFEQNTNEKGLNEPLLTNAIEIIVHEGKASTSFLQRKLSIGYARAARIIEHLESVGVLGELDGIKPRIVYIDKARDLLPQAES